jgi:hypothetical protein
MANALRKDRYTPTAFQEELAKLELKDNGSYTWLPNGCQSVANCLPQDRLDKNRIDKDRLEEVRIEQDPYFPYPEVEEVFQDFLTIRKKLKAVNSDRAIKSLVSKINEYSDGNPNTAIKVIEQSIENSWKGIFPLKNQKKTASSQLDAIMNA